MQISRAAFAVILKFTEKIFNFEAFCDNVKLMAVDVQSEGAQKVKEIVSQLKSSKNADFEECLKRWETANQMRKWTQSIKLNISERTAAEEEQAFRDEYNKAHPSDDPLTGQLSEE